MGLRFLKNHGSNVIILCPSVLVVVHLDNGYSGLLPMNSPNSCPRLSPSPFFSAIIAGAAAVTVFAIKGKRSFPRRQLC